MYNSVYTYLVSELNISEFRRSCLKLLESLPPEGLVVTKRGRAVARVIPARSSPLAWMGSLPNLRVNAGDDLFSTGIAWDAES